MASTINATTTSGVQVSGDNSGVLQLQTNSGTTAITIDAAQNVGIGTASPTDNLDVAATEAASNVAILARNLATSGNSNALIGLRGNNNSVRANLLLDGLGTVYNTGAVLYTETNHPLLFGTNSTERMRIDSSGNAMIGTTGATGRLTVVNTGATSTTQYANTLGWFSANATNADCGIGLSNGVDNSVKIGIVSGSNLYFAQNGVERMRIDSSGNVGIGTNSPSYRLHVVSATENGAFVSDGTRSFSIINSSAAGGPVIGAYTNHPLLITTNNTERMRIDTSGNLLVGTTTSRGTATFGTSILPVTTNAYNLGSSTYRWSVIYLANNPDVSSDERLKTDIQESDLGLAFVNALRPVKYKLKVGQYVPQKDENGSLLYDENGDPVADVREGVRYHYGFIAQEVKQVLGEKDAAFWSLEDKNNPDSQQALSYEQLISPLVKAIQEQQTLIKQLTERISALENK